MYNFTIIIPHKNTPNLLQRCLDSIPIRDDLQIIIVDDNSDPNIVDFKNFPGSKRTNTEVIFTKEGRGAGYARNVGLKSAKGKWVLFADADDFYENDFHNFLSENVNSDADCIYFSVNSVNSETLEPANRNFYYDEYFAKYKPQERHSEDWILYNKWEPWNKMISLQFIKEINLCFEEISKCNDMIFSMLVSYCAKKIKLDPRNLYCITFREQSITNKKTSVQNFRDCLVANMKRNEILRLLHHEEWSILPKNLNLFFYQKESHIRYYLLLRPLSFLLRSKDSRKIVTFKKRLSSFVYSEKVIE